MLHFTQDDQQMMNHVVDVVTDRMRHEDGYTEQDDATMTKLDTLTNGLDGTSAVVITGDECPKDEAALLFQDVVKAELKHWVPGASQRLLFRAGRALGIEQPEPRNPDCGQLRSYHALVSDWVAGLYVQRCSSCARIYEA